MGVKPLYLIRREYFRFVGPMSLPELRVAYSKMTVGPQDEVCGHCGEWVPLDDLVRLRARYPEVAVLVGDENAQGWAVSGHSDRVPLVGGEGSEREGNRKSWQPPMAGLFLGLTLMALVVTVFLVRHSRRATLDDGSSLRVSDAAAYIEAGDQFGLMGYLDANAARLIPRVLKSRSEQNEWLPYLRLWAFLQQGQVAGLPARVLKGDSYAVLPPDCSLGAWATRWDGALDSLSASHAGTKFVRAAWTQVLAWDPYYVARRPAKGWITPKNYMEACLSMALKSLDELDARLAKTTPSNASASQAIAPARQRLLWQLELARGKTPSEPEAEEALQAPQDTLSALTCMEKADSFERLVFCQRFKPATEGWKEVLRHRFSWSFVRLALPMVRRGEGGDALKTDLAAYVGRVARQDSLTQLDWSPELAVASEVLRRPLAVEDPLLHVEDASGVVDLKLFAGF